MNLCSKCVFEIKNKITNEYECSFSDRLEMLAQNGALVDLDKRGHHIVRNRECNYFKDRANKKIGVKVRTKLEQEVLNREFSWNAFLVDIDESLTGGVDYVEHFLREIDDRVKSVTLVADNLSKYLGDMASLIAHDKRFSLVDISASDNKVFDFNVVLNTALKKTPSDYYLIIEQELDDTPGYINYIIDRFTHQVNYNCKRLAATRSKEEGFGIFNTSVHFALGGLLQMNDTELIKFLTEEGKLPPNSMPLWESLLDD